MEKILEWGLVAIAIAAAVLLLQVLGIFGKSSLMPVSVSMLVLMSAMGLVIPNANALAMMRTERAAGSASALLGASSVAIGAAIVPLVGLAGEHAAVSMAAIQVGCALIAIVFFAWLRRPWRQVSE